HCLSSQPAVVHDRPSVSGHGAPSSMNPSAGQVFEIPLQLSARSHSSTAARQTAVLFASAGQPALEPVQFSARSHTPADPRHSTELAWKPSAGQSFITPSQPSATSHAPAGARQTAVLFPSAGHVALDPVQDSPTSHTPAEARHSTELAWKASAGQSSITP